MLYETYDILFQDDQTYGDRLAIIAYLSGDDDMLRLVETYLAINTLFGALDAGEDRDMCLGFLEEIRSIGEMDNKELHEYAKRQDHRLNEELWK